MKKIRFTKMEGIGNDYVYVDAFREDIRLTADDIQRISNRNFGVGGDGVIFIRKSDKADFMMDMYNSDGSSSGMCGNGVRCVGKYVYDHGLTSSISPKIETGKGVLELKLEVSGNNTVKDVTVDMGPPFLDPSKIPVNLSIPIPILDHGIRILDRELRFTPVGMGNPHAVIFVDDTENFPVSEIGPILENNPLFPNRTNVEFVTVKNRSHLIQRTWERGAGETLACGTGACAVAVAGFLTNRSERKVRISLRGGDLEIEWIENGPVIMKGPAREVFTGEIILE